MQNRLWSTFFCPFNISGCFLCFAPRSTTISLPQIIQEPTEFVCKLSLCDPESQLPEPLPHFYPDLEACYYHPLDEVMPWRNASGKEEDTNDKRRKKFWLPKRQEFQAEMSY